MKKSVQSHYFIKFTKSLHEQTQNKTQNIDEIVESLKKIQFRHDNTVGPRSISKQELIKEFNVVL